MLRQPRLILAKALVERVVTHGLEPVSNRVKEIIKVRLVLSVVKLPSRFGSRGYCSRVPEHGQRRGGPAQNENKFSVAVTGEDNRRRTLRTYASRVLHWHSRPSAHPR